MTDERPAPDGVPKFARALIRRFAPREDREFIAADLEEEYAEVCAREGARAGRHWYWRQVVMSLPPLLRERRRLRAGRTTSVARARGEAKMETFAQDVRFALRAYARSPLFFLAAALTLATGMGASSAIFSVVSGVLLKPMAYAESDRLVFVGGADDFALSMPDIVDLRTRTRSFEGISAWQMWRPVMRAADGVANYRWGASTSAEFFDVLRIRPRLGRFFLPADAAAGHLPMVVLSHQYWQAELGGREDAIGSTLVMDTTTYTVVGVAPAGFEDPFYSLLGRRDQPSFWRVQPEAFDRGAEDRTWIGFWSVGRLARGVTLRQAQDQADALVRQTYPELERPPAARVAMVRTAVVEQVRPTLIALMTAVTAVLLIACVNVANLLLSRASVRRRELAVRVALGASARRLTRLLFTEGLVLSLASAVLGLGLAGAATRLLVALAGSQLPRAAEIGLDWRVLAFAAVMVICTALLFGASPLLQLGRERFAGALREGGRGSVSAPGRPRFRHALVVVETALAVILLSGAGLLLRTVWNLQNVPPGFDVTDVTTARVAFIDQRFPTAQAQNAALDQIVRQLASASEVVGAISDLPMSGAENSTLLRLPAATTYGPRALIRAVSGDYFAALRVPLRRGRWFTSADAAASRPVAILNESLAEQLFPGDDPIGREVVLWEETREVVGIVADVKEFTLAGGGDRTLYLPYSQARPAWLRESMSLVVRAASGAAAQTAITTAVHDAGAALGEGSLRPAASLIAAHVATPRLRALLLALFAGIALVLAAVGIASVLAFTVAQRVPEMGVRMALGADRGRILRMVLGSSARLAATGVLLGWLGALVSTRLLSSFLFGVTPAEPRVLLGATLLLFLIGVAAGWLPARRAAGIDPALTLRCD